MTQAVIADTVSAGPATDKGVVYEAKVYGEGVKAPWWEIVILTTWFCINYVPLNGTTPLLYLCVLYFVGQLCLSYKMVIPVIFKAWPLFLLPIFGAFSFMWSPYQGAAMRTGIFFLLTPLIMCVFVARVEPRQIQRALLYAGMFTVLLTLPKWGIIPQGGPYAHKNHMAVHILFCMLFGLAAVLDREEETWLRLLCIPFVLVCPLIIIKSLSATSLVMMLVGSAGMIAMRFLIVDLGRIKHMRTTIIMFGAIMTLAVIMLFLSLPENNLVATLFEALGKDGTLSGRTHIWEAGRMVSAEHPIAGVGLEGFWQYDVGAAQTVVENDYKDPGTKLGFHSAFLEVQVHLGYIGLTLFWFIVIWCIFKAFKRWVMESSLISSAYLLMTVIILTFSFTEGWLWGTFNAVVTVFYVSAMSDMGAGVRKFLGVAKIHVPATEPEAKPA